MASDLEAGLNEAVAALELDSITVVLTATQISGVTIPSSGEYLAVDLVPGAANTSLDGSVYEDLLIQVGSWSDSSLTLAIENAEAARVRLADLGYQRSGGTAFLRDEDYVGVALTYRLVAAYDTLT